jgi:hypothetical protein
MLSSGATAEHPVTAHIMDTPLSAEHDEMVLSKGNYRLLSQRQQSN